MTSRLRPARFDDLGLKRAVPDRLLPVLVAAMAFLAALAWGGAVAAASLALHWQSGAGALLTVQVPNAAGAAVAGSGSRLDRVASLLRGTPGVADARVLGEEELQALLAPWLGAGPDRIAVPLPAVVEVRLADPALDTAALATRLAAAAPGTILESQDVWVRRLAVLARSLQACAGIVLGVVAGVSVAVVTVATRAGLSTRRDAIEIVHGLGATDGYIAGRFARRATGLATVGAAGGALGALPVLLGLSSLASPLGGHDGAGLPGAVWLALPALPVLAAAIGWATAQATVRRWLRRLP